MLRTAGDREGEGLLEEDEELSEDIAIPFSRL